MEQEVNTTRSKVFEHLMVALLSVNNYPLERAWELRDHLRRAGLFDPAQVAGFDQDELVVRLKRGGYDRGDFLTGLVASRLATVAQYLVGVVGSDQAAERLTAGSKTEVTDLLIKAKGIGPVVIRTFLLLRDSGNVSP